MSRLLPFLCTFASFPSRHRSGHQKPRRGVWLPVNLAIMLVTPGNWFARNRICTMPIGLRYPGRPSAVFYINLLFLHVYIDLLRFEF